MRLLRRASPLLVLGAHPCDDLCWKVLAARGAAKKVEGGVCHRDAREPLLVSLRTVETEASN